MLGVLLGVSRSFDLRMLRCCCTAPTGVIEFVAEVRLLHDVIGIGYRLRAARALRGLSLAALAEMVGCNKATLSRYECGLVARPSMTVLILCAERLGVAVPWLYGMESISASGDDEECVWLELACSRLSDGRVVKYKRVSV